MCWSWEVSMVTSAIVTGTVATLFCRNKGNDRSHALWTAVFGSMQIVDAVLWTLSREEDMNSCSLRNHFASKAGVWVIVAEPFASLYASHWRLNKRPSWKALGIYYTLCLFCPMVGRWFTNTGCLWRWYCTQWTSAGGLITGVGIDPNGGIKCWRQSWLFGPVQEEIPLILRVFYLCTISYPFLQMTPRILGVSHVFILSATWFMGLMSASHASIWCLANVAQCFLCLVEPYAFPPHVRGSPIKRSKRQQITQDRFREKDVPTNPDAIFIGSGIGSLATAGVMAKAGKRCVVLEQHYRAGGCTHTFDEIGKNLFDSGIHYVGVKDKLDFMLSHIVDFPVRMAPMGSELDNYTYDEFDLGDGDIIKYRKGPTALLKELVTKFPHEEEGIMRYWQYMKEAGTGTDKFAMLKILPKSFLIATGLDKWLYKGFIKYAGRTAHEVISEFVQDKKLRALLGGGQLIDWNLEPDRTSWWVVASMMSYYKDGGFYPEGGSHKMAEAIIPTIEKAGGRVLCRAQVKRILVRDEGKHDCVAYGVEMQDGTVLHAPIIVSNAGAGNTYERLLSPDVVERVGLQTRVPKVEESHGHITAFVCLDNTYDAFGLRPSNIHSYVDLPSFDYDISKMQRAFYADPFSQKGPLITLTCPSAKDPLYSQDFPGTSNVLMLCEAKWEWFSKSENGNYGSRQESYKALKEQFTDMFLERLYKYYPACQGHVTHIELGTPLTTEHFLAAPRGGSYGHEWTPQHFDKDLMDDYFHPVTRVRNLYLTGEASFFGGLAGAMASGYITALKVLGLPRFLWTLVSTSFLLPPDESAAASVRAPVRGKSLKTA